MKRQQERKEWEPSETAALQADTDRCQRRDDAECCGDVANSETDPKLFWR